ncbi:MAG: MlaD family protein [Cytophagaceae bacterium]|nr:MlaD family protein [Cytophagaceae bacterium]
MTLSKEFKVGVLAIASSIVLYFGFNFLKGNDFFKSTNIYYVIYDRVDGLTASNPITINGFPVGRVKELRLIQDKGNKILVTLELNEEIQVGDSTFAMISKDLLGSLSVVLTLGKNSIVFESGDTLRPLVSPSLMSVIESKITPVVGHLDTTIVRFNDLLNENMRKKLYGTVSNMEKMSGQLTTMLQHNDANIQGVTANLNQLTANLIETEKQLKPMLKKFSSLADSLNDMELKKAVQQANTLLVQMNGITKKINEGEGTLGKFITDSSLYVNLNRTMMDLDTILVHFQDNPRYYLKPLGTKPKKK